MTRIITYTAAVVIIALGAAVTVVMFCAEPACRGRHSE